MPNDTETKAAVQAISRVVNCFAPDVDTFTDEMSRQHRTLQQGFTGLCIAWLEHLDQLESGQYDLRNQASVELAKRIVAAVPDRYLPCI